MGCGLEISIVINTQRHTNIEKQDQVGLTSLMERAKMGASLRKWGKRNGMQSQLFSDVNRLTEMRMVPCDFSNLLGLILINTGDFLSPDTTLQY